MPIKNLINAIADRIRGCKHDFQLIKNDFPLIGWEKCQRCGKEKYTGRGTEFTKFHLH